MENQTIETLLAFFKALSDTSRLKIIGLLANKSYTVEQLSALLGLNASTISHHLSRLSEVDLVSAQADGYYNLYSLNTITLENMSKSILTKETLQGFTTDVDLDAFDRKIRKDFLFPDGSIKQLPAQEKKFVAILKYLLEQFELGKAYPEKELNEIIARFHEDYATIRRGFIEFKMMTRENGIYTRIIE